jgi:hypothetical protein
VITYEITAAVEPALAERYERFMRERHIPDLMATGCFVGADLTRSAPGRYRVRYEAPTREALDRYLREHAERLRAHFTQAFGAGVQVAREEWEHLEHWTASATPDAGGERRRDYRLHYPESLRAALHVDQPLECASEYPVIDIAERGLRYLGIGAALRAGAVALPPIGTTVSGRFVTEPGAAPVRVAGVVVRHQDGEVALHLTLHQIPLAVFFAEQRRVLARARHAL